MRQDEDEVEEVVVRRNLVKGGKLGRIEVRG